jgi:hypothetical protein
MPDMLPAAVSEIGTQHSIKIFNQHSKSKAESAQKRNQHACIARQVSLKPQKARDASVLDFPNI